MNRDPSAPEFSSEPELGVPDPAPQRPESSPPEPKKPLPPSVDVDEIPTIAEETETESAPADAAPAAPAKLLNQHPIAPNPPTDPVIPPPVHPVAKKPMGRLLRIGIILVVLILVVVALIIWLMSMHTTKTASSNAPLIIGKATTASSLATTQQAAVAATTKTSLSLDTTKDYGNKYSNGLLPVGDKKYTTTGPSKGNIYLCNANFNENGGGAGSRGPWFTDNNTEWNINKKDAIAGSVSWTPSMSVKVVNGQRIITTNDLPPHITGVFPVSRSDPAYPYDANPNTISAQDLTYTLSANPSVLPTPKCMGGESGVMLTGVALFNGFDAGGRDAGAWEVQDACDGHPQDKGEYHYHTLSRCIKDQSVSTVIGYALDGFPITGPKVGTDNILTTSDLDECHGITSAINLDGKSVTMYHYVMTEDFPYSVSCFRGTATGPPGQTSTAPNQSVSGSGSGTKGPQSTPAHPPTVPPAH